MKNYKYYSVHFVGRNIDLILEEWNDVREAIRGKIVILKGFNNIEDAEFWLKELTPEDDKEAIRKATGGEKIITRITTTDIYGNIVTDEKVKYK